MPPITSEPIVPLETVRDETLQKDLQHIAGIFKQMRSRGTEEWILPFRALVKSYEEVDKACLNALQKQQDGSFDFSALLSELESIIPQYVELANKLPNPAAEYDPENFIHFWNDSFEAFAANASKRFTVSIPKRHLQKQEMDSFILGSWKTLQRGRLQIWERSNLLANWVRRKLKRKEFPKPRFKRRIAYQAYLRDKILVPVEKNLLQSWSLSMAELAELLIVLHQDTHQRMVDLMLLEDQQRLLINKELNEVLKHIESIKTRPLRFDEISQRLDALDTLLGERFATAESEIHSQIQASWQLVGTVVYPNILHHPPRITNRRKQGQDRLIKIREKWVRYLEGEREDRLNELELALLQTRIPLSILDGLSRIKNEITHEILPAFAAPHKIISKALERFKESESESEASLRHGILSENRTLLRDLRRNLLPRILESILQARLPDRITNLKLRVKYLMDQLPETHTIFRGQRLSKGRPLNRFMTIELKALVYGEVFTEIEKDFSSLIAQVLQKSDKLSRDVTEIDQIIEFNLGAALELLSKDDANRDQGDAFTVVTEGLERARNQLSILIEESQQVNNLCRDSLSRISQNADKQLLELANNEKAIELQVRITQAKLRDRLIEGRKQLLGSVKSFLPKLTKASQTVYQNLLENYRRFRRITGLTTTPLDLDRQLLLFLSETRKQIDGLPFVYQRLFRFEPTGDERFFIGREKELQVIDDNFQAFKKGRSVSVALIGESGSGRTSLLNMADQRIFTHHQEYRMDLDHSISRTDELYQFLQAGFNISEATSLEDLRDHLNGMPTSAVVIIENIQNMFLRMPGGFEAIKRFLLFMNETSGNVFWVIVCGRYAWSYYERILGIRGFFQEVIVLQELDNETVEQVIMKRHRVSGYQLEFEVPESLQRSRPLKRSLTDSEKQVLLRRTFFEHLNRLAAGNLTVAILFWLKAIKEIKTDRFVISPSIEFDPTFLSSMPKNDLFTFAAFLQHEILTIEHHALIFHQDIETSRLQISRLEKNGILIRRSKGYQIHYLLYRPVVKTLNLHNIIH